MNLHVQSSSFILSKRFLVMWIPFKTECFFFVSCSKGVVSPVTSIHGVSIEVDPKNGLELLLCWSGPLCCVLHRARLQLVEFLSELG